MEARRPLAGDITIEFDDSYDTSGFFSANPQAMTVLQEAGQILGGQLENSLAAITPNPGAGNTWNAFVPNPSDPGGNIALTNPTIPANTIIVYVGGSSVTSLYQVFTPGYSESGSSSWGDLISSRGQTGGLAGSAPTTGSISFGTGTNWSFGGTSSLPGASQYDFLTATLEAMGTILDIGTAASWKSGVNATGHVFTGAHAEASYGGPVPLSANGGEWAIGLQSDGAEPMMDGLLNAGQQKEFTPLDWAGLDDIGWITDQLVVTAQPPALVTVGADFGLTVTAQDPDGHVDTLYNGPVTLALGNNPGSGALGGTLTASAGAGIATFGGLSINHVGDEYTLLANSSALPSATTTTSPFNIMPAGQATQLVVTAEPAASVAAGAGFGLGVTAEDGFGHVDSSFDDMVTVALGNNPGNGVLGGTLTATSHSGVATVSGLTLDTADAGYTVAASATNLESGTTAGFTITANPATQLVVTSEPPADVLAGNAFTVVVSAEDQFGNVDPSFDGLVTLTLGSGPAGATLSGVDTATAVSGIATFSGPIVDLIGASYTLKAAAASLPTATTSPFNVVASTASSITIDFNYSYDTSGFFTANPQAKAVLQEAAQILGSELHNSLAAIAPDPGLGDNWTAVTFDPSDTSENIDISNLNVPAGTIIVYVGGSTGDYGGLGGPGGYSSSGSTTWQDLVASRGQAGALADPPTGFGPWGGSVSFNIGDTWNFSSTLGSNFLATALHELSHVLGIGTAGSWFTDVDVATSVFTGPHADASFGGPVPLDTGTGVELGHPRTHWATGTISNGDVALMTPDAGNGIVTPLDWAGLDDIGWMTDQLVITDQPPQSVAAGTGFVLTVAAEDPDGQVDTYFNGQVTLTLGNNPESSSLGGTLTATAVNGIATFSGLSISKTGAGYTLLATSTSLPSVTTTTHSVNVTPSPTPTPTPAPRLVQRPLQHRLLRLLRLQRRRPLQHRLRHRH